MDAKLDGRVALVTGGSKGLGLAIAVRMAASGADVALLARRADVLEEARQVVEATAKSRVRVVTCDVSQADEVAQAYDEVVRAFGRVDILVNKRRDRANRPVHIHHGRGLAGRSRSQAVRRHPPGAAGLAGDGRTPVGADRQRAQHPR